MNFHSQFQYIKGRRFAILCVFLVLTMACSLPSAIQSVSRVGDATSAPPPTITPTPQPLPPDLAEIDPQPGTQLPLDGGITLYFNQAMERASVEQAIRVQVSLDDGQVVSHPITYSWQDNTTLSIAPETEWLAGTDWVVEISSSLLAANGLNMAQPISLNYKTLPLLEATQILPEPGTSEVDPSSALVVSFNQPVVALGADPATLPAALNIEPVVTGRGEWVNTSTYIYYPETALFGGATYSISLNSNLQATSGVSLAAGEQWTFTTASPALLSIEPEAGSTGVSLDPSITLTFNHSMDPINVEGHFTLQSLAGEFISGTFEWEEDDTVMVFTPSQPLSRNTTYSIQLPFGAQALGGSPLGESYSAEFSTVSPLTITSTDPQQGGFTSIHGGITIFLSSLLPGSEEVDLLEFISITPDVPNLYTWLDWGGAVLNINGSFMPMTEYQVLISGNMPDQWGGTLGADYAFNFQTSPLEPSLNFSSYASYLFITPRETSLAAQASNLYGVDMFMGQVPFIDFVNFLQPGGYDVINNYYPLDAQGWTQELNLAGDRQHKIQLNVQPDGSSLSPGIYHLTMDAPGVQYMPGPFVLVSSNVHLTMKLSATQVFVWAIDLRTNTPVANGSITVYGPGGITLINGVTDANGIFQSAIPAQENVYDNYFATLGQPGDDNFAITLIEWKQGIDSWDFGISSDFSGPENLAYIYTDRPIYRPGQTVSYRAILRQAYNGRYTPAILEADAVTVRVFDQDHNVINEEFLTPSRFGTVHGQYTLAEDAQPGTYEISTDFGSLWFDVAEYRKPEIDLQVSVSDDVEDILADQLLQAEIQARYFFDAPAGDIDVRWELYKRRGYFSLPGYKVGEENYRWLLPYWMGGYYGQSVASGEGQTNSQGILNLELEIPSEEIIQNYTLEVTMADESGFPLSARTEFSVHPADVYVGVRPDTWLGQAGNEIAFEVLAVDWNGVSLPDQGLTAIFQTVTWERVDADDPYMPPEFIPRYEEVSSAEFRTGSDGIARLAFTPPAAGTYQLEISGPNAATTQTLLWVGGQDQAIWPNLSNQRLRITADKTEYAPGETAEIFIPNPFGAGTQALVTVERGIVSQHYVLSLNESGYSLPLPMTDDDAPNVYISATLIGNGDTGNSDFRQGYLNLLVEPTALELNVEVTAISNGRNIACRVSTECSDHLEPRQDVTFDLRVTDNNGNPVQGEFSLTVADLAALALADPNSEDILTAFYDEQPLGVSTSLALTMHVQRQLFTPGGMGGGGGDAVIPFVREDFPDTAYWNAEIVTDANGQAQATFTMPDSLTTWHVDVRGLTENTRVGQAEARVVSSKDLLVRPVTPRFFVVGDHVRISAVVHNNSASDLQVDVALQAAGLTLDDPNSELQEITLAAGNRQQVIWWGTVEAVNTVTMIFSASGQNPAGDITFQDITKPVWGDIPVVSYLAPQTYGTAGVLAESGERLELVSLPQSYDPDAGELSLELAPSLAAAMTAGLDVLEHYPYECTEQTVARFLPNLEAYRAIQGLGVTAPDLQARLERTLDDGLERLLANQNFDGGWSWWPTISITYYVEEGDDAIVSDPYITAYVLFSLSRAKEAGVFIDEAVIQNASNYLLTTMASMWSDLEGWRLDRIAFIQFVLTQANLTPMDRLGMDANELFLYRDRLSPWAQAMLSMTFENLIPGDERAATLRSDLNTSAIRTATGTHWEGSDYRRNMETGVFNTAVVIYALSQQDPASATLPEAVRFLMDHRGARGAWASTYETAWTILSLTEVMKGTGELAGDFAFAADVNGTQVAQGQAGGDMRLNAVTSTVPMTQLYGEYPNALSIQREAGPGRLYYTAHLNVMRPVEDVEAANAGITVERAYEALEPTAVSEQSRALTSATAGETVNVRLTVTLDSEVYYLIVEDYIPAGAEVLNANLKTSQQAVQYDTRDPFDDGWSWWYFNDPQTFDDHIAWAVDYLPAGTYELTYLLVLNQPGQYQVIPAQAWQFYFPEVYGNSAGMIFEIIE